MDTYDYKRARQWGLLGWAVPVMEMMLWGNGNTVDFIMTLFSEALSTAKSYLRIEASLAANPFRVSNPYGSRLYSFAFWDSRLSTEALFVIRIQMVEVLEKSHVKRAPLPASKALSTAKAASKHVFCRNTFQKVISSRFSSLPAYEPRHFPYSPFGSGCLKSWKRVLKTGFFASLQSAFRRPDFYLLIEARVVLLNISDRSE